MAPKILAICGSTRAASSNLHVIQAVAQLARPQFEIELYQGLEQLPQFNPDRDNEHAPVEVVELRQQLHEVDGVLICTPEYAVGVPGALKNALDWTVSSTEFTGKPVALITASLSGEKAHRSLLGTLLIIGARMTRDSQTLISAVRTKVGPGATIKDAATREGLVKLVHALAEMMAVPDDAALTSKVLLNEGVDSAFP